MSIIMLKFIFATLIVVVIISAGLLPFKKRLTSSLVHEFAIGETLATGIFLGAALLHMLPEANQLFISQGYHYPFAFIITGLTFLFFLWFEHLGSELYTPDHGVIQHKPHGDEEHAHHHTLDHHHDHDRGHAKKYSNSTAFALLAWIMLSIHSFILGTSLGLNHSTSIVIMLFLAIITHKWAESFAIAVQLNKSNLSFISALIFFLLFAFMTPLGIFTGWYFGHHMDAHTSIDPMLISASAGTFLYLGTLHGLEQCVLVERCCNLRYFSFVIIGFLLMAGVAVYV